MGTVEELEVYKRARDYRMISKLTNQFPVEEKYRLTDQLIRSTRSITAQIAEGHGRFHFKKNVQFCRIARGSLEETHDHLNVAFDEGYISEVDKTLLVSMKSDIARLLNGYIRYLRMQVNKSL